MIVIVSSLYQNYILAIRKVIQLSLFLLFSIVPLSATEKLIDMNKFELLPPPKMNSFQKYQINENIIFGTNFEKKPQEDGGGFYYRGHRISLELLKDDDFTLLQDIKIANCCGLFYFKISDDFGNSVYYKYKSNSIDGIDIVKYSGDLEGNKIKLKMVKEGKKLTFYINDKLLQLDDSKEMVKLERIQYIEYVTHYETITSNVIILKD